jgi:hypothetical protein
MPFEENPVAEQLFRLVYHNSLHVDPKIQPTHILRTMALRLNLKAGQKEALCIMQQWCISCFSDQLSFTMRWSGEREEDLSL